MHVHRLLMVAAFVVAGLVVPSPASASMTALTVSPAQPVQGQTFTIKGTTTPRFARPVQLQRWLDGKWRAARSTTSTSTGSYSFTYASSATSLSFRTYVPRTRRGGHTYSAQTSAKLVVKPVGQEVSLSVAEAPDEQLTASVGSTPSVAGRTVTVQRAVDDEWVDEVTGPLLTNGVTSLTFDQPSSGEHTFRAVVSGTGFPSVTSPTVQVVVDEPLPRIDVTTTNGQPIESRETYSAASIHVDPRGSDLAESTTPAQLRVRGNSTSYVRIKLSYKIKLDSKAALLGMPKSKNWVLLSNFYDRSMLRNSMAFEASRRIGLPWTPRMRYAELWLNGSYRGLYQFGEGIEAENDRVVVPSGGFLLQADGNPDDDPMFQTDRGLRVYFKDPDDPTPEQMETVSAQVQAAEDAMYAGDTSKIDVDTFVDWYLVNEFMKNYDSAMNNSDWMFIGPDGTLSMGPVWDFDQSGGNRRGFDASLPTGLFTGRLWWDPTVPGYAPSQMKGPEGHWFNQLLAQPAFRAKVQARWAEVQPSIATLPAYFDRVQRQVAGAAARNFADGNGGEGLPIGPSILDHSDNDVFHESWDAEVTALRDWLVARADAVGPALE